MIWLCSVEADTQKSPYCDTAIESIYCVKDSVWDNLRLDCSWRSVVSHPGIVLATVQSHVVLLTHKMSTHSVSEATRSHRPIEVILNSPGRNADRNAFARLVSPGRGNNFLITFLASPIQTAVKEEGVEICLYETVRSFIIVVSRFA